MGLQGNIHQQLQPPQRDALTNSPAHICSWDFTEGRLTGSLTGHTALSFLNSRADDIIFLQRNLSGVKKFLQILQILKCSLTAACM